MKMIFKTKSENETFFEESLSMYNINGFEVLGFDESNLNLWNDDEYKINTKKDILEYIVFAENEILNEIKINYSNLIFDVKIEEEDSINWNKRWIDSYKPVEVGSFIVLAPWHDDNSDKKKIIIDPAMAFGTGYHETTSTCIVALEKYLKFESTVYDVGCGSAILSIVASILGAKKVVGIEIDENAIKNANHNIELNSMSNIKVCNSNLLTEQNEKSDLIIANILPSILKDMVEDANRLLNKDGILILSGILNEKVEKVKEDYKDFEVLEIIEKNEWSTIVLKKD